MITNYTIPELFVICVRQYINRLVRQIAQNLFRFVPLMLQSKKKKKNNRSESGGNVLPLLRQKKLHCINAPVFPPPPLPRNPQSLRINVGDKVLKPSSRRQCLYDGNVGNKKKLSFFFPFFSFSLLSPFFLK